jgi:hypothetical protein
LFDRTLDKLLLNPIRSYYISPTLFESDYDTWGNATDPTGLFYRKTDTRSIRAVSTYRNNGMGACIPA